MDRPVVRMKNVVVENMAGIGLLGFEGSVDAINCVFGNAGQYSAALTAGDHTTEALHVRKQLAVWQSSNPCLLINNWYEDAKELSRLEM